MNIQLAHISKLFGGQEVLKDVSFSIGGKERVGLLGNNGSGKSTVFKILMGEEQPDGGFVIKNPRSIKIGYLSQVIADDDQLSSGQKLKKRLGEILEAKPDMLLLDEPTNHLDWQGMDWLEREIQKFSGPVLVVSHDRYFLDRNVQKILELSGGKVSVYGGNYTLYKQQKQVELEANERKYFEQQKRLGKLEERQETMKNRTQQLEMSTTGTEHYARRKAAKAASSAVAMEKRIRKELAETKIDKPEPNWELRALFRPKQEGSRTVVQLTDVNYKGILKNVSLTILKGQRLAVVGKNGCGKTTLLKMITGELVPEKGKISVGSGVQIGYLSQEHRELDLEKTVLDELTGQNIDKTESYKLLHRFLLPPEKINQPVRLLSSGEKAKLLLAKIMTSGANFIILDEPTNHLDIPSREAIEGALANCPATLLVVSHDRYFLQRVGVSDYLILREGSLQLDVNREMVGEGGVGFGG